MRGRCRAGEAARRTPASTGPPLRPEDRAARERLGREPPSEGEPRGRRSVRPAPGRTAQAARDAALQRRPVRLSMGPGRRADDTLGRPLDRALAPIVFGGCTSTAVAGLNAPTLGKGRVGGDWTTAEHWSTAAMPTSESVRRAFQAAHSASIEGGEQPRAEILQGKASRRSRRGR